MTATLTAPANGAGTAVVAGGPAGKAPLWGGLDVPIIVGTGDFGTGKTSFGITICPGPETLVYDNEGSSLTFKGSLNFEHIDMANELRKTHGAKFTPEQRYIWWREHAIEQGKSHKYRVLVVDPASELEDGLADHIRTHVSDFGLTMDQVKKSSGLFWAAMKREWKNTLDMLRTYYETVYLTVHLRNEYVGNAPTGKLEPKGKETLYELSSLFLWFEKKDDTACPTARVLKSRLSRFAMNDDGDMTPIPVLPPNLPQATPGAIRRYIAKPPNYSKLKKEEKVQEHVMSEDEKLRLQAQIASANKDAAEAEVSRLQIMQQNAAKQAAATAAVVPPPDQSAAHAATAAAKAAANARPPISQHQVAMIVTLINELFGSAESPEAREFLTRVCSEAGVARVSLMNDAQGDGVQSELLSLKSARQQVALKDRGAELMAGSPDSIRNQPPVSSPPFVPSSQDSTPTPQAKAQPAPVAAAEQPGPSPQQIEEFQRLIPLACGPTMAGAAELINKHGAPRAGLLTPSQMDGLLAELKQLAEARANATANAPRKTDGVQLDRLRGLAERTGWAREKQQQWLDDRGLKLFSDATYEQIDDLLEQLLKVDLGFSGGMPGNS